ncbi:hypothetical protein [Phytohabitans rumicis]|uniref:Lipoprotein n=1 Tax=Phytohabitans rumicis TaxID=1076125 RepID=A0A6V8LMJ1_9ACTN|nr:hypothetical protein [Phytohabitans rumicis]GFJ95819.1 hypothetical protein Prum_094610 [Phytohabitans rumicis]
MRGWAYSLGVVVILLSGCSFGVEVGYDQSYPDPQQETDYSYLGPLEESDCVSDQGGSWHEVSCTAPEAQARVTKVSQAQGNQRFTVRPDCPPGTDLALSQPGTAGGTSTLGYFCARNLKPPHPGDPGEGGGIIEVGDCVHAEGESIDEVPCDGSGAKPQYKILQITRAPCQKDRTDASFSLGSTGVAGIPEGGFACAKKL